MKHILFAIALLVGLQCIFEVAVLKPLHQDVQNLATQLQQLQSNTKNTPPEPPKLAVQLEQVLQQLEASDTITQRLEALHRLADQNGIVLRKASYRTQQVAVNLHRDEMTADLVGSYPGIRQFLRQAQGQDQAIAIESIEFSRPNMSGAGTPVNVVRAQVRLALYSHPATL
jgi:hypothetical protein